MLRNRVSLALATHKVKGGRRDLRVPPAVARAHGPIH